VMEQDYPYLNHIVIDGQSTDTTLRVLSSHKKNLFKLLSAADSGIYDAMNKSIEFIDKDEWVIFLNSGDKFINNNVLRDIFNQIESDLSLILGDTYVNKIGGQGKIKKCKPYKKFSIPTCHQSMLFRGAVLLKHRYDIGYKVGADFDLYLKIQKNIRKCQIKVYENVISEIQPEGYSAQNENILQADYFDIIKKNYGYIYSLVWLFYRKIKGYISN
jgi:glycosyltransferase involved in cell wall biosynthesis